MIRILFVDDEAPVLTVLEARLRPLRTQWDMRFARGAAEALVAMEREPFDVLVADSAMPGMDGAALLAQVRELYPRMVRLILAGDPAQEHSLRILPVAQQVLTKPCEAATLRRTVERCHTLNLRLHDPAVREAVGAIRKLPALPKLYWDLVKELDNPDADAASVARIMERDVAMTARVLQVANSAYFAPGRKLTHLREAVTYLGMAPMRSMVLAMQMFHAMSDVAAPPGFSLARLQAHSLRTAELASGLVRGGEPKQTAFSAGMLHDIGRLVLALALPERWIEASVRAGVQRESALEAEFAVFGCTHAEVGAHLLSLWGLPNALVEAVAYHHAPALLEAEQFGAAGAVHVADALAHAEETGGRGPAQPLDVEYLRGAGQPDNLEAWRGQLARLAA